jgi:hypothetical protein
MFERQHIWYKRFVERSKPPFSDDPIMVENRFTNTYRELDRGTKYALAEVLPCRELDDQFWNVFMRTLAYRLFNKVSTYDKVFRPAEFFTSSIWGAGDDEWENLADALYELHENEPIFTRAHVIPTFGAVAANEERKSDAIIAFLRQVNTEFKPVLQEIQHMGFEEAHRLLMKINHIGDFLAFEILSDLAYTGFVQFDEDEWANAGPGARDGLKLIYPNDSRMPITLMKELQDQQDLMFASLGLPIYLYVGPSVHNARLTLRNIEGGLCEYYKYNSCVNGKKRLPFQIGQGYVWK